MRDVLARYGMKLFDLENCYSIVKVTTPLVNRQMPRS